MTTLPTYLVFGATGRQGGATVSALLKKAPRATIRAITRNPDSPSAQRLASKNVQVLKGDMDDTGSLSRALAGVNAIHLVTDYTDGPEAEIRRARNVIQAAKGAGVGHIVFSSVDGVGAGVPHWDSKMTIEQLLRESGTRWTVLRPAMFMETIPVNPGIGRALILGMWKGALAGGNGMALVSTSDIGWFAAEAITHPDEYSNLTLPLAGDQLSVDDAAKAFDRIPGGEAWIFPIPSWIVYAILPEKFAKMMRFSRDNKASADIVDLKKRHPGLLTFGDWLVLGSGKEKHT